MGFFQNFDFLYFCNLFIFLEIAATDFLKMPIETFSFNSGIKIRPVTHLDGRTDGEEEQQEREFRDSRPYLSVPIPYLPSPTCVPACNKG